MLNKFGRVLTSRQSGAEAYAAFLPTLAGLGADEEVVVDFNDVLTFAPSWGDEFLTPLSEKFGDRLRLKQSDNPSVVLTLETLEAAGGMKMRR